MNSIFRAVTRLGPELLPIKGHIMRYNLICKKWAHNFPTTYDFTRERILLILRLFDKIDPNKLTLESHFIKDLGLDSLDHVEIIMALEDEFNYEIPDADAEKLLRPKDILRYLTDHDEAYEELQRLQAESHALHHGHGDHGHGDHGHGDHHQVENHTSAGSHEDHTATNLQKRTFCSLASFSRRYMSDGGKKPIYPTTFRAAPPKPIDIQDIQDRVMKVCSKYDKIDSSQLQLASHFVDDLGLDSLDHVEILMELEDEFGLEIPDQDAEKLMRPAEIARFIFHKEEARSVQAEDRKW